MRNSFFRQEGDAGHLAVVFPGIGYRCFGPLLYYPSRLLMSRGADVLWVEYEYDRDQEYERMQPAQQRKRLFADASAALDAALGERSYRRLTLVGKSLGTLALGHLLATPSSPLPTDTRAVWLTPLLTNAEARDMMGRVTVPSLYITGSADALYDREFARKLGQGPGAKVIVVDGADHSLDVADAGRSVEILKDVLTAIEGFVFGSSRPRR